MDFNIFSKKMTCFVICVIAVIVLTLLETWIDPGHILVHFFPIKGSLNITPTSGTSTGMIVHYHNSLSVYTSKIILLWVHFKGAGLWKLIKGDKISLDIGCQEARCLITNNKKYENISSAIVLHMQWLGTKTKMPHRNYKQYWIFTMFESPTHTQNIYLPRYRYAFNKTLTYRTDSDFYQPYGHVVPKEEITTSQVPLDATNRTKLILWYVSNCFAKERLRYAQQLAKYVKVDMFGRCGKRDPCRSNLNVSCVEKTKMKYKFYLAFENSRCPDYITEKFWLCLRDKIVPVVLGPKMADYEKVAPPHSFIHVDNFTSPKHLADYIKYLDKNDEAYYKYHMWRNTHKYGTETNVWCKLCSMLHQTEQASSHQDIGKFWSPKLCF